MAVVKGFPILVNHWPNKVQNELQIYRRAKSLKHKEYDKDEEHKDYRVGRIEVTFLIHGTQKAT